MDDNATPTNTVPEALTDQIRQLGKKYAPASTESKPPAKDEQPTTEAKPQNNEDAKEEKQGGKARDDKGRFTSEENVRNLRELVRGQHGKIRELTETIQTLSGVVEQLSKKNQPAETNSNSIPRYKATLQKILGDESVGEPTRQFVAERLAPAFDAMFEELRETVKPIADRVQSEREAEREQMEFLREAKRFEEDILYDGGSVDMRQLLSFVEEMHKDGYRLGRTTRQELERAYALLQRRAKPDVSAKDAEMQEKAVEQAKRAAGGVPPGPSTSEPPDRKMQGERFQSQLRAAALSGDYATMHNLVRGVTSSIVSKMRGSPEWNMKPRS